MKRTHHLYRWRFRPLRCEILLTADLTPDAADRVNARIRDPFARWHPAGKYQAIREDIHGDHLFCDGGNGLPDLRRNRLRAPFGIYFPDAPSGICAPGSNCRALMPSPTYPTNCGGTP